MDRVPPLLRRLALALALVGAWQGGQSLAHEYPQQSREVESHTEAEQWMRALRRGLLHPYPFSFRRLDDIFGKKLFIPRFDPFTEMDKYHRRLSPFRQDPAPLDFMFRPGESPADIDSHVTSTRDTVVVLLRLPGLEGTSLEVDVNEDRIRISYNAHRIQNNEYENGLMIRRRETVEHFEKILPIPAGADPKTSRIEHAEDTVRIVFDKMKTSATK